MSAAVIALTERLGHRFNNPRLAIEAMTHRSYGLPNNERLEFIGDSVLNCVSAELLYRHFSSIPEGQLSRLRAHLVSQQPLCDHALGLRLGEALFLGDGEARSGGRERPSILADALEALFGAVFVDAGFDAARAVVVRLIEPSVKSLDPNTAGRDAKTVLQEWLQGRRIALPVYSLVKVAGQDHAQTFTIEAKAHGKSAQGVGNSRRVAEQAAAAALIKVLT